VIPTNVNDTAAPAVIAPELLRILGCFQLDSAPVSCERYGHGHINRTYLVTTAAEKRYILQRINNQVFPDVAGLMENISLVTEHIRARSSDPRGALSLVPTLDGAAYAIQEDGYWRIYEFVEHSVCRQISGTVEDFYESAVAFGRFQHQLADFPAEKLHEVIPDFHNTPNRYRLFREVLERDPLGRAAEVQAEIAFALAREEEMATLQHLRDSGSLPIRVTHNDTKLNNVLLDEDTGKPLCVVDLDTVMPGLSLYDFGDSIRFGASTAAEDEKDLSRVNMSLEYFRMYTRGFLEACPGLTPMELRMLPMGAKTMTMECGLRFLTDYLDGDHYFSTSYAGQNLDRCRTQFKLVSDMEKKWDEMQAIVQEEIG